MKLCAVVILLFLLAGRAPCRTLSRKAMNLAILRLQHDIQDTVDNLNQRGILPNVTCPPMNTTEIMGAAHEPLTKLHISNVVCHLNNMTDMAPLVKEKLKSLAQISSSIEGEDRNITQCSLPPIEEKMRKLYVKCFLVLLKPRFSHVLP